MSETSILRLRNEARDEVGGSGVAEVASWVVGLEVVDQGFVAVKLPFITKNSVLEVLCTIIYSKAVLATHKKL